MSNESPTRSACCGAPCWAEGSPDQQPCWGDIDVIDEEYDDENHWWIHGCQGHTNGYAGPYVPKPDVGASP